MEPGWLLWTPEWTCRLCSDTGESLAMELFSKERSERFIDLMFRASLCPFVTLIDREVPVCIKSHHV